MVETDHQPLSYLNKAKIIKSKVDAVVFNFAAISIPYCRDMWITERSS